MPVQESPIDFIAYDRDGRVVLLAEAKSRNGTSKDWAAKLRRNMLSHGILPPTKYFLIATPDKIYGWKQENLEATEVPPHFTVDAGKALAPYFAGRHRDPQDIGRVAFDWIVYRWLTDLAMSPADNVETDPDLKSLSDSGLLSSLRRAHIEMNAAA